MAKLGRPVGTKRKQASKVMRVPLSHVRAAINPTEAVYGFAAWLTTRDQVVSFGHDQECAIVAELVDEYVQMQNWPKVTENYPDNLRRSPCPAPQEDV